MSENSISLQSKGASHTLTPLAVNMKLSTRYAAVGKAGSVSGTGGIMPFKMRSIAIV